MHREGLFRGQEREHQVQGLEHAERGVGVERHATQLFRVPQGEFAVAQPPETVVERRVDLLIQVGILVAGGDRALPDLYAVPEYGRGRNEEHGHREQGAQGIPTRV